MATGSTIHAMLEQAFKGVPLENAIANARLAYAHEVQARGLDIVDPDVDREMARQGALAEGLVRGWFRARWPAWHEEYQVARLPDGRPYVEVEDVVELGLGVRLQVKTDLVAQRRADGALFVWSWKSTGYTQQWQERWDHDLQRLTEVLGVEKRMGREVEGVIVEGLYTGRKQDGVQVSPLIRGYEGPNGEVTHESCTRKGWSKFDAWERFGTKRWVEEMLPVEVLWGQYLQTEPLERRQEALDEVVKELVSVATGLDTATKCVEDVPQLLSAALPRNMGACHKFGRGCEFIPLCFGGVQLEEATEHGFMIRVPHHEEVME